jgi:hypothetical protein
MKHLMSRTRLAVCRHEAAHAVMAERFGARAQRVVVYQGARGKHRETGHSYLTGLRKLGPVQLCCVVMAGSVAESLWHGTPKGVVSGGDFRDLEKYGLRGEDLRIIWEETSRLLRKLRPKVWRLAARLMRHGKVTK